MRIPTWFIVAFSVAFPVATMAAEGNPAAGKARAEVAPALAKSPRRCLKRVGQAVNLAQF